MKKDIYTSEQWAADGSFKAEPGQEIEETVYNELFNVLPPLPLPIETAQRALTDLNIPVHAGFLMGEPHSHDGAGALYLAFGRNNFGKGPHYFFIGLSHAAKRPTGEYYVMECMNAFVDGQLIPVSDFRDQQEAIETAANYEATLYRVKFENGRRISTETIYTPQFL